MFQQALLGSFPKGNSPHIWRMLAPPRT